MKIKKALANWVEKNDHNLHFWSGIGHLGRGLVALLVFVFSADYLISSYLPNYAVVIKSHKLVFSASLIWFMATVTLIYAVYSSRKYKNLALRLGASCAENMKAEDYSYAERRKIVKNYSAQFHESKKLYVLGATGFHTFAKRRDSREDNDTSALLRPVIDSLSVDKTRCNEIEIDILLLHPKSKYAAQRVKGLNPPQTLDEYQEEIMTSLRACLNFKKELPNLRCFVYDRPLIWKLIITDSFAWQQFYKEGTHAEHSRINIFTNLPESGNALYHPFLKLFELLRDSAASEIDLSGDKLEIPSLQIQE